MSSDGADIRTNAADSRPRQRTATGTCHRRAEIQIRRSHSADAWRNSHPAKISATQAADARSGAHAAQTRWCAHPAQARPTEAADCRAGKPAHVHSAHTADVAA